MRIKALQAGTRKYRIGGSSRFLIAEVEGLGNISAIRQGSMGTWACPEREKMSQDQQSDFDNAMDAAWRKKTREGLVWSDRLKRYVSIPANEQE